MTPFTHRSRADQYPLRNTLAFLPRLATLGALALAALGALSPRPLVGQVAAAAAPCNTGTFSESGQTLTCTYSSIGAEQVFSVPVGVTSVQVVAVGGRGSGAGGSGDMVTANISGLAGILALYVEVAGNGSRGGTASPGPGGFNGGGAGGNFAGGGGGASDVRLLSATTPLTTQDTRLIVAGGGGGSAGGFGGGNAGYPAGGNGGQASDSCNTCGWGGEGGQADQGGFGGFGGSFYAAGQDGSLGAGGAGGFGPFGGGGGGGGGYYGGGGGGGSGNGCGINGGCNSGVGAAGGGGSDLIAATINGVTSSPVGSPTLDTTDSPLVIISYSFLPPTNTPTNTPMDTPTNTPTTTPMDTPTNTPTNTPTTTPMDTPTNTPTNTPNATETAQVVNATATALDACTPLLAAHIGGGAVGAFAADPNTSSNQTFSTTATIDTSAVANPAPQALYQTQRFGAMSYTLSGLTPSTSYTLRLHDAELYYGSALFGGTGGVGSRLFDVMVNGQTALSSVDVVALAGGANRAIAILIPVVADASGNVTVSLSRSSGSPDLNPILNGIELLNCNPPTSTATSTPTTSTPTTTPTDTATSTPTTSTPTPTPTDTPTNTPTPTPTNTPTTIPTSTDTATNTPTRTTTPTRISTNTPTNTDTATATQVAVPTNTPTATQTAASTNPPTSTATVVATNMPTETSTPLPNNTSTATAVAVLPTAVPSTPIPPTVVPGTVVPDTATATMTSPSSITTQTATSAQSTTGPAGAPATGESNTPTPGPLATATTVISILPTAATTTVTTDTAPLITDPSSEAGQDQALVLQTDYAQGSISGTTTLSTTQIVVLVVPTGAVSTTTQFSSTVGVPSDAPVVTGTVNNVGFGAPITLQAYDEQGNPIHTFDRPLILQLSYDPAALNGIDPTTLTIAFFDPLTNQWVSLPTTVDTTDHLLTAMITHFTMFQVRTSVASPTTAQALTRAQHTLSVSTLSSGLRTATGAQTSSRVPLLDGVPVVVTVPEAAIAAGQSGTVRVIGPANAHIQVFYRVSTAVLARRPLTMTQTGVTTQLDAHGYAAVPAPILFLAPHQGTKKAPGQMTIVRFVTTVTATLQGTSVTTGGSFLVRIPNK